jgi:hypothetical protein
VFRKAGEDASDEWVEVGAEGVLWKKLLTSIFRFEEAESVVATVVAVVEDDAAEPVVDGIDVNDVVEEAAEAG